MTLSQLIFMLQKVMDKHGDLEVVSGLDRSGYGEPVVKAAVVNAVNSGNDEKELIVDLVLDKHSSHEMFVK